MTEIWIALICAGIFLMWIPACCVTDKLIKRRKLKKGRKKLPAELGGSVRSMQKYYQHYCNGKGA